MHCVLTREKTAERTHQVQQMGAIFSRAKRVISWLGISPSITEFIHLATEGQFNTERATPFVVHEYWTRAWVTQEIVLAQEVSLMVGEVEFPMKNLPSFIAGYNFLIRAGSNLEARSAMVSQGTNLIHLLDRFSSQQCHFPQDRVFSLLALSGDASTLQVDYEISPAELVRRVIALYKHCFCLCSLYVIGRALSGSSGALSDAAARFPGFRTCEGSLNARVRVEKLFIRNNAFLERSQYAVFGQFEIDALTYPREIGIRLEETDNPAPRPMEIGGTWE